MCPEGVLPTDPQAALEVLRQCALSEEWIAGLTRRQLGQIGIEEQLCKRGRKQFTSVDGLATVAKKCGIKTWDLEKVSGPRSLVVGFHLARELEKQGMPAEAALYAGEVVAGMHGSSPTVGGWRQVSDPVLVSHGPVLKGTPVVVDATAPATSLDRTGSLVAKRSDARNEDLPVFGFPFTVQAEAEAPVQITPGLPVVVTFGVLGDVLEFPDTTQAMRAVRHWLDWSQEYGTAHPDRIWVQQEGTVQEVAEVFSACFTLDGVPRFREIVVAPQGRLLPWSKTVDGVGLKTVD